MMQRLLLIAFCLLLFMPTVLVRPSPIQAQSSGGCTVKYSPSPLVLDQLPLNTKDPNTGQTAAEDQRRINFEIQVSDQNALYQVVFYRPSAYDPGQIFLDNLAPDDNKILRTADGKLASLLFGPTASKIFDEGRHTFDVIRKNSPGVYCRGSYTITKDTTGGIQSCNLQFQPDKPSENDLITISGTLQFNQAYSKSDLGYFQAFRINLESKDLKIDKEIPGIDPATGKITPVELDKLNPGIYKVMVQKKYWTTNALTGLWRTVLNTNCQYTLKVAVAGQQGNVTQVGQAGPPDQSKEFTSGGPDSCNSDTDCAKSGGIRCNPQTGQSTSGNDPLGTGIQTAIGCIPTEPTGLIKGVLRFSVGIGGGLALLMMIFGVIKMLLANGNPESLKKGQEQFTSAVIGLLFVIFSVLLIQIIGVDILNLPGFGK